MTLLANAVTSAGLKLCRIYDPTGSGIGKVLSRWTVAPFTGDALGWKYGRAIYIVSTRNVYRRSCVAEDATLGDRPCEIRILHLLVAGSQIVCVATLVKSDRRLEEMTRDVD
jgi:hypothetical protein